MPPNKKLFGDTVPPNKKLFGDTVPPNKKLFGGTVPPNKKLFGGTVPPNNFFLFFKHIVSNLFKFILFILLQEEINLTPNWLLFLRKIWRHRSSK